MRKPWSRDPIEERGGINLYGMVGNDPVNKVDRLGLQDSSDVYGPFESEFEASTFGAEWSARLTKALGYKKSPDAHWLGHVEFGGSVCMCEKTCKIGVTEPRTDNRYNSVRPSSCPVGWKKLGTFHSHPSGNSISPSNSPGDRDAVDDFGYSSSVLQVGSLYGDFYRGNPDDKNNGEHTKFKNDPKWDEKYRSRKKIKCE
jgi:uncharacterized protein RhaS with RHS repeats